VKGIQVCSNKEPWGDNHKNAKIGWGHLKSSFQKPQGQKSSDLDESFMK
jgi:hypothetical protein